MRLEEFDYPLPKELIAQVPLEKRDESKLMVVNRGSDEIDVKRFFDITDHINEGDLLVVNDTKVFPARIFGEKSTGGRVELLLIKKLTDRSNGAQVFSSLSKSSKPLKPGQKLFFDNDLTGEVTSLLGEGKIEIAFRADRDIFNILDEIGVMPLPPYIKRDGIKNAGVDKETYQTVYAENVGAIAAPTAGFHFTDGLIDKLTERGVKIAKVTLHVGLGTFLPVRAENILDHDMHEEFFSVSDDCMNKIAAAKAAGNRVIAVGTTSMRSLESAYGADGTLEKREGETKLFIYPGYKFKVVDAMITNFHLPKSTLLMLVYAFGGTDLIKRAYKRAVDESFRFFSYGDSMFIS